MSTSTQNKNECFFQIDRKNRSSLKIENIAQMLSKQTDLCVYSVVDKLETKASLNFSSQETLIDDLDKLIRPFRQGTIFAYNGCFTMSINTEGRGATSQVVLYNVPDQLMAKFLYANTQYVFINLRS